MLTLYADEFWVSPYVFTCFVGLREKGLAFETRTVSLGAKEQQRREYRDASLTARVPALDHDGWWLSESMAIVEYWLRSDLQPLREARPSTSLGRLIVNGDEVEPKLRAYFDARWARPSVREFVERARPPFEPY